MEERLESRACDGFNIIFPCVLDDFVDHVVPELRRRGLFRSQSGDRTKWSRSGTVAAEFAGCWCRI